MKVFAWVVRTAAMTVQFIAYCSLFNLCFLVCLITAGLSFPVLNFLNTHMNLAHSASVFFILFYLTCLWLCLYFWFIYIKSIFSAFTAQNINIVVATNWQAKLLDNIAQESGLKVRIIRNWDVPPPDVCNPTLKSIVICVSWIQMDIISVLNPHCGSKNLTETMLIFAIIHVALHMLKKMYIHSSATLLGTPFQLLVNTNG